MPSRNPGRPPADLLLSIPPESVSQGGPYHFNSTSSAALPVPSQHLLWINKSLTNHNLFFLPSHITISHPQLQHKIVVKPQATPARNLSRLPVDFLFSSIFLDPFPSLIASTETEHQQQPSLNFPYISCGYHKSSIPILPSLTCHFVPDHNSSKYSLPN